MHGVIQSDTRRLVCLLYLDCSHALGFHHMLYTRCMVVVHMVDAAGALVAAIIHSLCQFLGLTALAHCDRHGVFA
jgi:hypothetical protein